jgi:hypothetical protein
MKKFRIVYYVTMKSGRTGFDCSQYLLPNEIHLIKTMLNDGKIISGVRRDVLTPEEHKVLFG